MKRHTTDRRPPTIKGVLTAICVLALFTSRANAAPLTYSQFFGLDATDAFGTNPESVTNAYIRHEGFRPQIQYWQPATPNAWSELIYKFDVPFVIQSASTFMTVTAYTNGHPDANFDNNAQSYLDVSPDGINWTNVLGAYPGHAAGYDTISSSPNLDGDISSIVAGSNEIFVRARQFMTADWASFNSSQFLRSAPGQQIFFVSAVGVPEPSSVAISLVGLLMAGVYGWRKRGNQFGATQHVQRKIVAVVASASLLMLFAGQSNAAVVPIFNTGVDSGGAALPAGSIDPHFQVEETGLPAIVLSDIYGAWAPNSANSTWIGWVDDPFPGNYGIYTFKTQFSLAGFDPSTASLSGDWAADNSGDMKLNGNPTGISLPDLHGDGHLNYFAISSGFQPGINTLEIAVWFPDGLDGLRLENLSLTAQPVPEPSSLTIGTLCSIAIAVVSRRTLRKRPRLASSPK